MDEGYSVNLSIIQLLGRIIVNLQAAGRDILGRFDVDNKKLKYNG